MRRLGAGLLLVVACLLALPHQAEAQTAGICGRTAKVRTAILSKISGVTDCALVTGAHLSTIRELDLTSKEIDALQIGDFDGLTLLTHLYLGNGDSPSITDNSLTTLQPSLFDDLTQLQALTLNNNSLSTLEDDVFENLTKLTSLSLRGNPGAPFRPTATARSGAGTVSSAGGTVTLDGRDRDGGPWGGNVTYSWSQTSGPTSGVTFDDANTATAVVTIPALTVGTELVFTLTVTGRGDSGIDPGISGIGPGTDAVTVTVREGICGRTRQVRTAIVAEIPDIRDCSAVADTHLAAISTPLRMTSRGITALAAGDFDGLTSVAELWMGFNDLETLPAGVFDELTALTTLYLQENDLATLPADVFENLTALTVLNLNDNPEAPFLATAVALPDDGEVASGGGTVRLDGSGSGGPWGTNVTYGWSQTSGPTSGVTFDDAASAKPVVTIPALPAGTELTFTLTVTGRATDTSNGTAPGTNTATVTASQNVAPSFTSPGTFSAAENQTGVGTVAATDGDSGDDVTGYAIQGGADASKFSIVASTGVLTFASAPNFEDAADGDGNNEYVVVVRATSGTGARVETADQTITVTVTDMDGEAPGVPGAPTVTGSTTSVTVSWTAPSNTGPPITSYDLQYRAGDSGDFTLGPQDEPGPSATITGLAEGTEYQVQARATNDEGDSDWSESGSGTTTIAMCLAPDLTGRTEIWTGTVTVAANVFNGAVVSYGFGYNFGALDPQLVTVGTTPNAVDHADVRVAGQFRFSLNNALAAADSEGLVLHVCADASFAFANAGLNSATHTYTWANSGLDWSAVTTRVLYLSGPTVPDAPTGLSATANGTTTIDLAWTAPADNGGASITGYGIEVSPNGTSSWTDLVANTGSTSTSYSHTGLTTGTTRHYRVSAINSVGTGAASNVDDATTDDATTTPPAIVTDGVQVTSTPATGDTYGLGETIEITVTFDNAVTVDTSGGTPRIQFRLDGVLNRWAEYSSGSGGTALVFTYTVLSGDMDADGIWLPENFIQLRSGTIRDATDNTVDATLTYAEPGLQSGHKVNGSTVPGAPTSLTATASGTTTINLSWTAPSDNGGSAISGYRIEVSPNGNSSWTNRVANTGTTSTTYSHTGLDAGSTRHYRVSAINSVGTGAASNVNDATTDAAAPTVPGAPTSLTATASGTSTINLNWDAPSDDGGSDITGYRIEVSPNGTSGWSNREANTGNTSTTYSHTGLDAGTTRHYRVSAINSVGTGAASSTANATTDDDAPTVPGAPTGLSATADGTSTIDLSWTAPTDNGGSDITGYRIEVSSNGSSGWSNREANTGNTSTSYSHTGLDAGTTRHYRVSAINSVGTGAASSTANATTDDDAPTVPGAPTGLSATADGTSTIDLSWTAPTDNGGSDITGYRIEVSSNGSSGWSNREANTGNTSTTYSHTSLSPGTTRHYRVSAINSVGTGAASNVNDATTDAAAPTVPGAPTSLTATASGTSTINLNWDAPSDDGGSDITGYRIEVSPNGTSGWSNREANTGNTSTTYSHTGLDAGTTRHYRVSAINSVGTGTASSTANATTDDDAPTVPGAPTGLSATADGTSTIDLSWTAPTDNGGSDITGYRIEVSSNGSSGWSNREANTGNTSTSYSHTGLDAGTTRHYRVSAINSVGTGAASSTANAATDDDAPTVPGAPTGLSATADGTSTIDLSWTAPTDNGGSDITGYRIEVSSNGSSGWSNREANTGNTSTTYSHTSLSPGTTRHYRVSAINSVGTGAASNVDDANTEDDDQPGLAVVTVHALETSVSVDGVARFELRRSGGDLGWLKVSYRHDESSDGNYVKSWGYFKPGVTRKGAAYDVGRSPGTVTARVTGPSDPLCTEGDSPSASCTDDYVVGDPSSASMQVTASASSSDDALEDALTLVDDLTPDVAAAVLLGEQTLGEAELAALDRMGNGNGRYDLGDLLSWIDRCRRGEARCGRTSTDSGPAAAALLGGAAAGGRRTPRRPGRRDSGRRGGASTGGIRRRARMAGQVLAVLLAATTVWSCTEGSVAPAAYVQDPGFLTVEWSGPATHRDVGVLLELEGPTIDAVRAPGLELYESSSPGPHRIVVAGVLRPGPLVQFRVPDRGQFALYRVRVLEVTGEGYGLRDPTEYRAVVIMN